MPIGNNSLTWLTGTPTGLSAVAYASGDALGVKFLLSPPLPVNNGLQFIVHTAIVRDLDGQNQPMDIIFLEDDNFAGGTNNDPFGPTEPELDNLMGHIEVLASHYSEFANNSIATVPSVGLVLKMLNKTLQIPVQLVTRGTPTHATGARLNIALGGLLS